MYVNKAFPSELAPISGAPVPRLPTSPRGRPQGCPAGLRPIRMPSRPGHATYTVPPSVIAAVAGLLTGLPRRLRNLFEHGPPFVAAGIGCGTRLAVPLFGCFLLPVVAANRQYMFMDGRPVFQWAVQLVRETIASVLDGAQLSPDEVDLVVLHQANVRIIDAAMSKLGIDSDKVFVNLDRYGNTSGGSVPLALAEAQAQGRIKRGDNIVVSGFGAGLAWGTAVMRW